MANKKYKAIPLSGATKVLRAHSTQIDPPGMTELENLYIARSDNAISLRSNWRAAYAGMASWAADLTGSDLEDYLNSAFYVSRSGHTIWFGRWAPFTWVSSVVAPLYSVYKDGTITTDGVKAEVESDGENTAWLQEVWPGCLIREPGDGNDLYTIKKVVDDNHILTDEIMPALTDEPYEILRVHPADRAIWPIRIESLGGWLVYGTVNMDQPIDERLISGPFYSNISRTNLGAWYEAETEAPEREPIEVTSISAGGELRYDFFDDVKETFWPICVTGKEGAAFSRNVFGSEGLYGIPLPSNKDISFTKAYDAGLLSTSKHILTLQGEHIRSDGKYRIPPPLTEGGSFETYNHNWASNYLEKDSPLGEVALYSMVPRTAAPSTWLYCGAGGLVGDENGTIYTTNTLVTLRSMAVAQKVEGGTHYYVVVGDAEGGDGVILTFTNPTSITKRTSNTTESLASVSYSPYHDLWVAVGTGGACVTSDNNGIDWVPCDILDPAITVDLHAVAWDDEGRCCCAVGDSYVEEVDGVDYTKTRAYFSLDGITWEYKYTWHGAGGFVDLSYNAMDGCFYALMDNGKVWKIRRRVRIEAGATSYADFGDLSDFICDAQHDGSQFIAVGNRVWTSPDAATGNWTERQIGGNPPASTLTSVAFEPKDGNSIVAVGLGGIIWHSADSGVTWTTPSSGVTVDLIAVINDGDGVTKREYLAIGKEGTVLKSASDGLTWSPMTFPTTSTLWAIGTSSNLGDEYDITISAQSAKIYYTGSSGGAGGFNAWAEWDTKPANAFLQDFPPDQLRPYTPPIFASIAGSKYKAHSFGASRNTDWLITYVEYGPSDNHLGVSTRRSFDGEFDASGYWKHGANSIAVVDADTVHPTYVCRIIYASSPYSANKRTGFITSTDGGRTWSTNVNSYDWEDPQFLTPAPTGSGYYFGHYVTGPYESNFLPICSDGTDFFAFVGTNQHGLKNMVWKLGAYEIDVYVEEVTE